MLILNFIFGFCISLNCFHLINGSSGPSYTLTAPRLVKLWTRNNVILSLHNTTSNTNVTLTISGSNELSESHTKVFIANRTETVSDVFEIVFDSQWKLGEYKLKVVGSGGYSFEHECTVNFVDKQYVILIQSDSPMYRPGDTVIFRVIILDEVLIPVKDKFIEGIIIYIKKNGKLTSSKIYGKNFFNIFNGLTNDISFELSDEVSLGHWTIEVELTNQKQIYDFIVESFETALATIDIKAREMNCYSASTVPIKIHCFYTFGKPVSGLATVLVSKLEECGNKVNDITNWSKLYNINGSLETKIDFRDTKQLNPKCDSVFKLTVLVNDCVTKQEYSNYKMIEFHEQSIVVKNVNPFEKIKPGLNFRVSIKFVSMDGNEVDVNKLDNLKFEAEIKSTLNHTQKAIPIAVVKKHDNMVLDFLTDRNSFELVLILKLNNKMIANYKYSASKGCNNTLIQIKLQEQLRTLIVDDIVNMIVTSTEKMDSLSYYFLFRGEIINGKLIKINPPDSVYLMPIKITREMAPDVTVIVHYYNGKTGSEAMDSIDLQIEGLFQNDIKIKVENSSIDVTQTVKFSIQTQPQSQLLLLGVDRAVLKNNKNRYITESSIINQLRYMNKAGVATDDNSLEKIIHVQSTANMCTGFYESPLEIICDDDDCDHEKNTKKNNDFIREDYRKTWIWDRAKVSNKGVINLSSKIPDSITSYQLSAISLHDQKGLGIATAPIQITASRPLFIELKLPYSIVRHEKTEVVVIIFNYLQETAQIDIMVDPYIQNTIMLDFDSCHGNVTALPNEIKIFKCFVTAEEIGIAELIAQAVYTSSSSTAITDIEVKKIIIEYEGVVISQVKEIYLDFTNKEIGNTSLKELLNLDRPSEVIAGSQKVFALTKFEMIKNNWLELMKKILDDKINFEFIAMDENTVCSTKTETLIQQIYQLNYWKLIGKTDESDINTAINKVKKALDSYCSQVPTDGSILSRSFNKVYLKQNSKLDSTAKSSTWMTAMFLKSLQYAKNYSNIDRNLIYHTRAWLERQQVITGKFLETDSQLEYRPNSKHFGLYLTSFVYIALESDVDNYEPNLEAISYINLLYPTTTNIFDMAIACYAFHLSKHQYRNQCFSDIMKKSVIKNDMRYWLGVDGKPDIETTSYCLLILVKRKVYSIAFNAFKYLKSVQNEKGMIGDPIQTSIALEAMSALIKSFKNFNQKSKVINIDINDGKSKQMIVLVPENEIRQIHQLSNESESIDFSANGYGSAVVQIVSQYNILGSNESTAYNTAMYSSTSDSYVNLTVCTRYNLDGSTDDAVIEIDLPTGYKYDSNGIKSHSYVRIESINDEHINIYLKKVESEDICLNVPAIQSVQKISVKPAPIKVYPNNDRSKLTVHELFS